MTDIKVEKTIYELLQEIRDELLNNTEMRKTGRGSNGKRDYSYFELADFLPKATHLFRERGMCPIVSIDFNQNGIEMATMKIIKGAEMVPFTMPTAEVMVSSNPIQNQGGKLTYMRRYLYQMALDLVENDIVDMGNEEVKPVEEKKATPKQVEMLKGLYDAENIAKMLEFYHISSLEELSLKTASALIDRKKK